MEETGKRLKLFRKSRRITLQEIADLTGLAKTTISDAENGKKKPSSTFMLALHRLYGVDMNWLLTGEGKMILNRPTRFEDLGKTPETFEDEYHKLLWYLENAAVARYAVLGFFIEYFHRNKEIIKDSMEIAHQKRREVSNRTAGSIEQ